MIHLHNHSIYSIGSSLNSCQDIAESCEVSAITDKNVLSGVLKFQKECKRRGKKPIFGLDATLGYDNRMYNITLLAMSLSGYKNMVKLSSLSFEHLEPHFTYATLKEYADDIICMTGDAGGPVSMSILDRDIRSAVFHINALKGIFGDRLYFELIDHGFPEQKFINKVLLKMSAKFDVKCVKTNDTRYQTEDDAYKHAILMADSMNKRLDPKWALYHGLTAACFIDLGENPNAEEISDRCNVEIPTGKIFLPHFPIPEGFDNEDEYLRHLVFKGFSMRGLPHNAEYIERANHELDIIKSMGFASYFLIVQDYVRFALDSRIPVGPGRGSGAGSLVAYLLYITNLDPIKFDLLFERFLNPERVSMPDFDIDFCVERREEVIEYLKRKYGERSVGFIGTFTKVRAKSAWKMVARAYGVPPWEQEAFSKVLPEDKSLTEEGKKSLRELVSADVVQEYLESNPHLKSIVEVSCELEGPYRSSSKHPAGVILADGEITDFVPMMVDKNGYKISQFDYKDVEKSGLLKFDFLGLNNLSIIRYCEEIIGNGFDINNIPLDDKKAFELISSGNVMGVFQIESSGMKSLAMNLKPDCLDDIIAMVALYRPGPLGSGMVEDYIDVKHGRSTAKYPHQDLEEILEPTNGVIVYQEQVMKIAQKIAGYSLGEADLLRRAMGKKVPSEMAKQKDKFVSGAIDSGYTSEFADELFDLVEKFASYGFNRSHSAAYGMIAYQTAYLKANYTPEYMAALINGSIKKTDKLAKYIKDTIRMGVPVEFTDVNNSPVKTTAADGVVFLGLNTIKGMSDGVAEKMVKKRPHSSLERFIVDCKFSKKACDLMIKSGSMDELLDGDYFPDIRARGCALVPEAIKLSKRKDRTKVEMLFSKDAKSEAPTVEAWSRRRALEEEMTTLGYYRSGHPVGEMGLELSLYGVRSIDTWSEYEATRVSGVVHDIRVHVIYDEDGSERRMAWVTISDPTGSMEVTFFSSIFEEVETVLRSGDPIVIEIERDRYKDKWTAKALDMWSLAELRLMYTSAIHVYGFDFGNDLKRGTVVIGDNGQNRMPLSEKSVSELCILSRKISDQTKSTDSQS